MSKWEIFRHRHALGVRMPSDNKTIHGAVRYAVIGGFDRENPEQVAEAERILSLIADAPALLDALEMLVGNNALHSMSRTSEPDAVGRVSGTWGAEAEDKARALIAKHRGGV